MVETIILNPKDRVLIYRDKEGKYEIREVTIHGENIYDLLPKASEILNKLRGGSVPVIEPERIQKVYACTSCGYTMPAFPEHPQVGRYYCPQCNKWVNFQKK